MTVQPRTLDHAAHRCRRATVADLMDRVPQIAEPSAPLSEVVHRMTTLGHREIVVAIGDRPQGVITPRHLAVLLSPADGGWTPRYAADLLPPRTSKLLPGLDLVTAARLMTDGAVEALPVVDHRGVLLGVIAHHHLVSHVARQHRQLPDPGNQSSPESA